VGHTPRAARFILVLVAASVMFPAGAGAARGAQSGNPYLSAAKKAFEDLDYEEGLKALRKARAVRSPSRERVMIELLEGVLSGELGNPDRALKAFRAAMRLDANAKLPYSVSPKVQVLFDKAKREASPRKSSRTRRTSEPSVQADPSPQTPPPDAPQVAQTESPPAQEAPSPVTEPGPSASAPEPPEPRPPTEEARPAPQPLVDRHRQVLPPAEEPRETAPVATVSASEEEEPGTASSLGILLGTFTTVEALGRSVGVGVDAGVRWRILEANARVLFGRQIGVGGELRLVPWDWRLSPHAALRGMVFPGAGAGGGPALGASLKLFSGFRLDANTGVELYDVSAPWRQLAWVTTVGLRVDTGRF